MIVNKEKYKWEVGGKQDSASLEAGSGWPPEVLALERVQSNKVEELNLPTCEAKPGWREDKITVCIDKRWTPQQRSPNNSANFAKRKHTQHAWLETTAGKVLKDSGCNWDSMGGIGQRHSPSQQTFMQSFLWAVKLHLHLGKDILNIMKQIAAPSVAAFMDINVWADTMNSRLGWMQQRDGSPCQPPEQEGMVVF